MKDKAPLDESPLCEICGKDLAAGCECKPCPVCGRTGRAACADEHRFKSGFTPDELERMQATLERYRQGVGLRWEQAQEPEGEQGASNLRKQKTSPRSFVGRSLERVGNWLLALAERVG